MSARRINPRLIKLHYSYTIEEIARTLGVHKNSVRAWTAKGLEPIEKKRRPALFDGVALRAFLEKMRGARKRPCRPGTMYCFRCREPRAPAMGMVDYIPINLISGNLGAMCAICETMMHRRANFAALAAIMPGIAIYVAGAQARLMGSASLPLNCDLKPERR